MSKQKNGHPVSSPENENVLDVDGSGENDDTDDSEDYESGMNDPGEWTIMQTGEPAADAISEWVFETPWVRNQPQGGKRLPTESVEIKEREDGKPTGREVTVFSHSGKRENQDLAIRLDEFFEERLIPGEPEPVRFIWAVMRDPLPAGRDYDSRKTFHVVNRAWIDSHRGTFLPSQVGTSGVPGLSGQSGMAPVSIFNGPSPLGLDPAGFRPPLFAPQSSAGIHGDIGGTGLREMTYAMTDAFGRMSSVMEKQQLFYADLLARQAQSTMAMTEAVGRVLLRHPDAEMERYRLEHEFRMRQYEGQGELELEKRRETTGAVKDLGGKLLENPGLTATLMGVAKKLGVTKEDIVAAIGGDEE